MALRPLVGLFVFALSASLAGIASGGMIKQRYALDNPVYSSFVYGQDIFVQFTAEEGTTTTASYGDRVRLRVTRLASENDRNRADTVTIATRVGSGDLPLVLEWLLTAEWSFATGDTTRVTTLPSLLDERFSRDAIGPGPVSFLVSLVEVDSSAALRASSRERSIRRAIADFRDGRMEEAALALRSEAARNVMPTLARCVYLGALERTGRCRSYAREQESLARSGIGNEEPESLLVARCRRATRSMRSEGQGFRDEAPERPFDEWFLGDQTFVEAKVTAVRDSATTNLKPPRVTLEIDRTLRGDQPGRTVTVSWSGYPSARITMPHLLPNKALRQWYANGRKGPAVGARFVLGLLPTDQGEWTSDPLLRWTPAEADEQEVRERIAATTPQVEERQERERPAREAAQRAAELKRAAEEAGRARIAHLRAAEERVARAHTTIADLVRMSDVIVVAQAPVPSRRPHPWGRLAELTPRIWLRAPAESPPATVEVLFGAREDTLGGRWLAMAHKSKSADSLMCIAFLRDAGIASPRRRRDSRYRPSDPIAGILRADDALMREVVSALRDRESAPTEPVSACGASLDEFRDLGAKALAEVAVKLSSVARPSGWSEASTLVLACSTSPAPGTGWFIPCTTPNASYHVDYETEPEVVILSFDGMRSLIASLRAIPEIAAGRVDPADQLTVSLRGTIRGEERIFEATLNESASAALSRRLAATFVARDEARAAFQAFWGFAAGSTAASWSREASSARPGPRMRPGTGAIVGTVVYGASSVPVVSATVRASLPDRTVRTNQEGAFELRDLPEGPRWIEYYGAGLGPQFKIVDVFEDSTSTVVLRLGNAAATAGQIAVPPLSRWTVDVRDDRGRAVPRAYVAVADSSMLRAGLCDASGRITFAGSARENAWLVVRAAGRKPFRTSLGSKESVLVRLEQH